MKILETTNIPANQLDALEQYARTSLGPELRDVLLAAPVNSLRDHIWYFLDDAQRGPLVDAIKEIQN